MTIIQKTINKIYNYKIYCISLYEYENATALRDIERQLIEYGDENITDVIKYIKQNYNNIEQVCEIIKPLERNIKLKKIYRKTS
jgi:hypothetical protein